MPINFPIFGGATTGGTGTGDVAGPASAVNDNIAVFDGVTGKLVKDGGVKVSGLEPADATILKEADVVNDLTGTSITAPLSAAQGTAIKTSLDSKQIYHGIESVGTTGSPPESILWDQAAGARTITLVGPVTYWYKGTRVHSAGNVVCNLLDYFSPLTANNLYYIAFEDATGTLKASQSMNLKEKVPTCMVFWNGTDAAVTYELHNHTRDLDWHINAHLTIGTRYRGGLAITSPTNAGNEDVLNVTEGILVDEDIHRTLTNAKMTSLSRIFYQVSAGVFTFENSTLPYAGTIGAPTFINTTGTYTPATFAAGNQFACYWVYGTLDIDRPLYIYPTHANAAYGSIALARAETIPNIAGVVTNSLNPEMKLLYRWIYKGNGDYQEVTDYRMSSTLPAGGVAPATAGAVTYSNTTSGLTATNVQAAIDEVVEDLAAVPAGDVVGPATNTDNNVPQWNGADSKTLKDGLAVGTAANNLLQLDGTAKLPAVDGSNLTNLPSGFSDPMTTRGDVIVRGSAGTTRLGVGTVGQVVTSDGTDVGWAAPAGETDPVVGAINGLVKANGGGVISAAIAGTDYAAAFAVQAEKTFFAGPTTGVDAAPTFRTVAATDIPTLNQNTTGTAANVTGTVAVANGGTGQTTAQAAIDALTAVVGATNEHVLTKDTATGNAVFKAAAGGGSGGHVIQDGGTPMATQPALNFTGAGVTLTNDTVGNATVVDIAAGGTTITGDVYATFSGPRLSLPGNTTDATPKELFLGGLTDTRILIREDFAASFSAFVTARDDANGDVKSWLFKGTIDNTAGITSIVGTVDKTVLADPDTTGFDADFTADDTNDALILTVTGAAGRDVTWTGWVDISVQNSIFGLTPQLLDGVDFFDGTVDTGMIVFKTPGSYSITPEESGDVEVLVVAGGGGGGTQHSAGGGAGGLIYDATLAITPVTTTVTVGDGGAGSPGGQGTAPAGTNGSNSIFKSETAIGGGGGGSYRPAGMNGSSGGSGGGGAAVSGAGGAGTTDQGYAGGAATVDPYGGGGGGGASEVGKDRTETPVNKAGDGGDGKTYFGFAYAGGGGGGVHHGNGAITAGTGGLGGGGDGGSDVGVAGSPGTALTGGGGGGGGSFEVFGGKGGSGIVIVRWGGYSKNYNPTTNAVT